MEYREVGPTRAWSLHRRAQFDRGGTCMRTSFAPGSSYATVTKRCQIAGFTLSETTYPRHFRAPHHFHEQAFFYTVLEGGYTETIGRTTLTPDPCTLAFRPAG